ncbi:MAG: TrkH family potassium uptake protein [Erysipelotrichaceae bacterium]
MTKAKKTPFQRLAAHPVRSITLGFFSLVLMGTLLLCLPIANQDSGAALIDHIFTAVSSVCVTGLTTITVADQYTIFGQIVILIMIQMGGLGLMTIFAYFMRYLGQKMSISEKIIVQESLNKSNLRDMPNFLSMVFKVTVIFEFVGLVLLSFHFIPQYGWLQGLYYSLFHSVSAFCNAGIDVLGNNSFQDLTLMPLLNFTIISLIITGGLGFSVWWDISKVYQPVIFKIKDWKKTYSKLQVQSKIAIKMTVILLTVGTLLFFLIEFNNVNTIGNMNISSKFMTSFFQSTTLRTAGFSTINLAHSMDASKFFMLLFMLIGGSAGGTAGGIKVTTFFVIIIFVISQLKGSNELVSYKKTINLSIIRKALAVVFLALSFIFTGIFFLAIFEPFSLTELIFEAVSAFATVGLSLGITSSLTIGGKIIIILLMFIGRIGSVSLIYSFMNKYSNKRAKTEIHYPDADVLVG